MSQIAPTASGSLATTPLAHLLVYALDHRLTGSLVLEDPARAKHALYFVEGAPAAARLATPVALFFDAIYALGLHVSRPATVSSVLAPLRSLLVLVIAALLADRLFYALVVWMQGALPGGR
jgi:hypothetical protein